MSALAILPAGDSALLLRLGDTIDPAINARALRIAQAIRDAGDSGVLDVVVGFASVTVFFDPLRVEAAVVDQRLRAAASAGTTPRNASRAVAVPVTYGGDAGPDVAEVAAFAGCTEAEVIERHLAREYRVFMVGFLPGFAYMGIVDERIAMPRRDTPRLAVPAGSVGIAGRQTGIYPVKSPGGWRLIGRTAETMFDPAKEPPALLQAGDTVRFVRV